MKGQISNRFHGKIDDLEKLHNVWHTIDDALKAIILQNIYRKSMMQIKLNSI